MVVDSVSSGTGDAVFPDIGTLSYNGVVFSSLQHTSIKSNIVQDDAKRTTKWVETTLTVVGYVTLSNLEKTTTNTWINLRRKLTTHGQELIYEGKGYGPLIVNVRGAGFEDVAYGPVPKILSFKPLGGARSAQIEWEVTVHAPEVAGTPQDVAQFNYEAAVTYDDEGYSQVSIRGVLEIQSTRLPNLRIIQDMADRYRRLWMNIAFDLSLFRVVRRSFNISRDKRTMDWEFMVEELPPMDLPFGAMKARGTMSVSPFRPYGGGRFVLYGTCWTCTLKGTYTIRKDFPPRAAAISFFSLLQFRMRSSANGVFPNLAVQGNGQQQGGGGVVGGIAGNIGGGILGGPIGAAAGGILGGIVGGAVGAVGAVGGGAGQTPAVVAPASGRALALLQDLRFDEGLYLDSKTMTWEATWILFTTSRTLLEASGVWRWPRLIENGQALGNVQAPLANFANLQWSDTVHDVVGWRSWLRNFLADKDVIVDFGGGGPIADGNVLGG